MTMERNKAGLALVVALLCALGIGYLAGREHLKYEIKTAVESTREQVGEDLAEARDAFAEAFGSLQRDEAGDSQ